MKYKFRNPQTGAVGEIPADHVGEALSDGMQPAEPIAMFNPHTKGSGSISQEKVQEALKDGLVPMGSTGERAAQMSGLEAGARKLASGASMGFSDEVAGALKALTGSQSYDQARDEYRQGDEAAGQALPSGVGTALEIGGGLASSLIPVAGPLGKIFGLAGKGLQAGSKAAIARSAAQGAASGLGYSDADLTKGDIKGVALDTALGAGLGAGAEAVLPFAANKVRGLFSKAKSSVADALDPGVQRAIAAGATARDLVPASRKAVLEASDNLRDMGLFSGGEVTAIVPDPKTGVRVVRDTSGISTLPNRKSMLDTVEKVMDETGRQIGDLYKNAANRGLSINVVDSPKMRQVEPELEALIRNAAPGTVNSVENYTQEYLKRMVRAENDPQELLLIKKALGNEAQFRLPENMKTDSARVATKLYGALNDAIKSELDTLAETTGDTSLSALNKAHHSAAIYREMLDKGVAAEEKQSRVFGLLKGSAKAGGMGALVGASLGGPGGAALGATAGQALDQMISSTEGRLARAELGDKLAARFGKVPRSSQAVRSAIEANPQQFVPIIGPQMYQAIRSMPPKAWEEQSRIIMPILDQAGVFEHSDYPSELDGKVAGPDKLMATNQLEEMKLAPSAAALRQSELNKNGSLPPELMPQTADQILKRISPEAYAQRLQQMGY